MKYDATLVQVAGRRVCGPPRFYSEADTDAAKTAVAHAWTWCRAWLSTTSTRTSAWWRRWRKARHSHRFKVVASSSVNIRRLAECQDRSILRPSRTPGAVQFANFLQGGAGDHQRALRRRTPGHRCHLVAPRTATCGAGPLRYYPGSHKIEQYVFSTGSDHFVSEEMPRWSGYMEGGVHRLGLTARTFAAKRGDVFIWSAHLLRRQSDRFARSRATACSTTSRNKTAA